jgi:hypothetical protein
MSEIKLIMESWRKLLNERTTEFAQKQGVKVEELGTVQGHPDFTGYEQIKVSKEGFKPMFHVYDPTDDMDADHAFMRAVFNAIHKMYGN